MYVFDLNFEDVVQLVFKKDVYFFCLQNNYKYMFIVKIIIRFILQIIIYNKLFLKFELNLSVFYIFDNLY